MEFHGYEEAPRTVAEKLIEKAGIEKAEGR
jgi:hypothetical protein